jgi:hypothetical protein
MSATTLLVVVLLGLVSHGPRVVDVDVLQHDQDDNPAFPTHELVAWRAGVPLDYCEGLPSGDYYGPDYVEIKDDGCLIIHANWIVRTTSHRRLRDIAEQDLRYEGCPHSYGGIWHNSYPKPTPQPIPENAP